MEAADAVLAIALLSGFCFCSAAVVMATTDVDSDVATATDVAATALSGFCSCSAVDVAITEAADVAASQSVSKTYKKRGRKSPFYFISKFSRVFNISFFFLLPHLIK